MNFANFVPLWLSISTSDSGFHWSLPSPCASASSRDSCWYPCPHVRHRASPTASNIPTWSSVLSQSTTLVRRLLDVFVGNCSVQLWCFRYQKERLIPQADSQNLWAHETTTVFLISIYQYIGLVIAFSTAAPFRKSFLTNCKHPCKYFCATITFCFSLSLFLSFCLPHLWRLVCALSGGSLSC